MADQPPPPVGQPIGGPPPQGAPGTYPPPPAGQPGYPPAGSPPQGYPPAQQGYPPQGQPPPQGYPPQDHYAKAAPPGQQMGMDQPLLQNQFTPGAPYGGLRLPTDIRELSQVQELYVRQKVDWLEQFTALEISNNYDVYVTQEEKEMGRRWMLAQEKSSFCQRQCFGSRRELDMLIGGAVQGAAQGYEQKLGLTEQATVVPMLKLHRPCTLCLTEMDIMNKDGQRMGSLSEQCQSLCEVCPTKFEVRDHNEQPVYQLKGPPKCWIQLCDPMPCRDDLEFEVLDMDGNSTGGSVTNVPNGCCKMCLTNADDYTLKFPNNATPEQRAFLLAMVFAIDYSYFEAKQENNKH